MLFYASLIFAIIVELQTQPRDARNAKQSGTVQLIVKGKDGRSTNLIAEREERRNKPQPRKVNRTFRLSRKKEKRRWSVPDVVWQNRKAFTAMHSLRKKGNASVLSAQHNTEDLIARCNQRASTVRGIYP